MTNNYTIVVLKLWCIFSSKRSVSTQGWSPHQCWCRYKIDKTSQIVRSSSQGQIKRS